MLFGYYQEVLICNRSLWHCYVKIFIRVFYDEFLADSRIFPAKPAVFVFLNFNFSHFVINLKHSTLKGLSVLLYTSISTFFTFVSSQSIRMSSTILLYYLEAHQLTKFLQECLHSLLSNMTIEASYVDYISIFLINHVGLLILFVMKQCLLHIQFLLLI